MAYFNSSPLDGDSITLADGTVFAYDGVAWNRVPLAGQAVAAFALVEYIQQVAEELPAPVGEPAFNLVDFV